MGLVLRVCLSGGSMGTRIASAKGGRRLGPLVACASLVAACGGSRVTPQTTTPSPEPPREMARPPQARATIADAVRNCRAIQNEERIPVSCGLDYIEGVPSMLIGFRSAEEMEQYGPAAGSTMGGPFCQAANDANRRAFVLLVLNGESASVIDCEVMQVVSTISLKQEQEAPLDRAVRVCKSITADSALPVVCSLGLVDDTPSLIFSFSNARDMNTYLEQAEEAVALPFCEAANDAAESASVFVTVGRSVKGLSCSRGEWSGWYAFQESQPTTPPTQPRPNTKAKSGGGRAIERVLNILK